MGNSAETKGKVITCKAAVVWGPGQPISIEEVQVHPPQKMEVRMKVLYTSICHTDLSAWKGENEAQKVYPRILGHEAAGIVESVGEGVLDMREGDKVVPIFNGECGDCAYCKCEKTNLCRKFRVNPMKSVMVNDGKTRFWTRDGQKPIYHFLNTSTFVEYTVLDSACVVKIDAQAPLRKMSLLSCGVSTGIGAAWNTANVQEGSSVAIFGLGAVGLAVAEGARLRGASQIIGIDINPDKFIKGKTVGITHFINPNDIQKEKDHKAVHEIIQEMTKGGVDYSFECSGNLEVLREAFSSTHDGWGLTVILGIHPSPRMLPLHPMELFDGRRIVGSVFGDFKGKTHLPHFALECMHGVVNLDGFITHELPFDEINEAFQLLAEGKALRCLLHL
ncbi:alcohol dehydrogenase-like 4 [Macadamia integrifolia]|uniref:alcohol dehydrogenase-like 4 n=1 Tax=Macadamia integrifolia TaxID=60698 RepID=UPI001C4F23B2|nr:alcohol dehydrogenase-like 4 [Macadamia integrifolia]